MNSNKMSSDDVLRIKLEVLREEHRDLDAAIDAMQDRAAPDQLAIKRLKRKKLGLKEQITQLEDTLTPDIIA